MLVTCQIMQYKMGILSDFKARGIVRGQEMSMYTRGAGKRVNCYRTWYQFKAKTSLCVAMMQRNVFSLPFS